MTLKFSQKINSFLKDYFTLVTSILSGLLAILYLIRGFKESFLPGIYIVIFMNTIFIPLSILFKRKIFAYFQFVYALILIFLLAFEKTYLFNNYTALFLICIVCSVKPSLKIIALTSYFVCVVIAFALNDEKLLHFFIHIMRSIWFVLTVYYIVEQKFDGKKLILYEDEMKILDQLLEGKVYQKEVEGFSENTIYRKLKAARERNGNLTRNQLVELYRKQKDSKLNSQK